MVTDGDTVTISGFVVAVTGDPPLMVYTNGPVPVKAMLKVVLVPLQVVGVPLEPALLLVVVPRVVHPLDPNHLSRANHKEMFANVCWRF